MNASSTHCTCQLKIVKPEILSLCTGRSMYRFKSSKYKNATPKVPKKGEVSASTFGFCHGFVTARQHRAAGFAFQGWVLDISVGAPQSFGNHIKASALHKVFSVDNRGWSQMIKIWRIPDGGVVPNVPQNSELVLQPGKSRIENLSFNPAVDCLLAAATDSALQIWDLVNQSELGNEEGWCFPRLAFCQDSFPVIASGLQGCVPFDLRDGWGGLRRLPIGELDSF
ncbi:hypothetical protein HPB51_013002 [Rhipicephalus microplus]|uniref:Uncharacterized protein n=1 Tax=Rhipicephalus microplus TaxID=6941 RepID=A0A9J6F412_RHIMP|nr:hypothetical protein HPB51_013002 [Rhipicephalus microplus]